jgi:RNA polymerase sigma factor (TIGR02999 family)
MPHASQEEVTRLLEASHRGDRAAFDALFSLVYEELHRVAHLQRQRWRGDHTLNTTALVHESYLKLVDQRRATWENQAHFLATAAKAIRHILMDYARDQRAQKRGGDRRKLSLEDIGEQLGQELTLTEASVDLLVALDEAFQRLKQTNERQSRIVECRFFGGMTIPETAAALEVSTATVSRGWALAKVLLYQDLKQQLGT